MDPQLTAAADAAAAPDFTTPLGPTRLGKRSERDSPASASSDDDDMKPAALKKRMDDEGEVLSGEGGGNEAGSTDGGEAGSAPSETSPASAAVDPDARIAATKASYEALIQRVHKEYLTSGATLGPLANKEGLKELLDLVFSGKASSSLASVTKAVKVEGEAAAAPTPAPEAEASEEGGDAAAAATQAALVAGAGAPAGVIAAPAKELTVFDALIARIVQSSSLPLSQLLPQVHAFITSCIPALDADGDVATPADITSELDSIPSVVHRLAERTVYGVKPKACVVAEDTSAALLVRWEVVNQAAFSHADYNVISSERRMLKQAGAQAKCLEATVTLLLGKKDEARIADQAEKCAKALRQEELLVQKHQALLQRQAAALAKAREADRKRDAEAAKKAELEAKKAEKAREAEAKKAELEAKKAELEAKKAEKAREVKAEKERKEKEKEAKTTAGTGPITKFFGFTAPKVAKPAAVAVNTTPSSSSVAAAAVAGAVGSDGSVDAADVSSAGTTADAVVVPSMPSVPAPLLSGPSPLPLVLHLGPQSHIGAVDVEAGSPCRIMLRSAAARCESAVDVLSKLMAGSFQPLAAPEVAASLPPRLPVCGGVRGGSWNRVSSTTSTRRMKFLQFHDNVRPAFRGTFTKRPAPCTTEGSSTVFVPLTGRRPLAHDTSLFNYDVDSDAEWEDDPEGESIGSQSRGDDSDVDSEDDEGVPSNELDYSDRFLCADDYVEYCDRTAEDGDVDMAPTGLACKKPMAASAGASSLADRKPFVYGPVFDLDDEATVAVGPGFDLLRAAAVVVCDGADVVYVPGFIEPPVAATASGTGTDGATSAGSATAAAGTPGTASSSAKGGAPRRLVSADELPALVKVLMSEAASSIDKAVELFMKECPETKASKKQIAAKVKEIAVRVKPTKTVKRYWELKPADAAPAAATEDASAAQPTPAAPALAPAPAATVASDGDVPMTASDVEAPAVTTAELSAPDASQA